MYNSVKTHNEVIFVTQSKVRMSIYVTPEEKLALQKLAEKNMRSMASEVRAIIVAKLKETQDK